MPPPRWSSAVIRPKSTRLAIRLRADAPDDPVVGARLDEIDMIRAEWRGDFITSHTLGDSLRSADADDRSWAIGTMIVTHHFGAIAPQKAGVLIDEMIDRFGEDPRSNLLRAELALGEGRFADAVVEHLRGWVPNVPTESERSTRGLLPTSRSCSS